MNKKRVPHIVIINYLYDQMKYENLYSFNYFKEAYDHMMAFDEFALKEKVSDKTLRNIINDWAAIDGRVGKALKDNSVFYYKIEPSIKCPYLLLTLKLKEWIKRWR